MKPGLTRSNRGQSCFVWSSPGYSSFGQGRPRPIRFDHDLPGQTRFGQEQPSSEWVCSGAAVVRSGLAGRSSGPDKVWLGASLARASVAKRSLSLLAGRYSNFYLRRDVIKFGFYSREGVLQF